MMPKAKYIGIFALACFLFLGISAIDAQSTQKAVTGWAWSDTVGWVSFSSTNSGGSPSGVQYGVSIDETNGEFSGYAWNDAIGWISFNEADTTTCTTTGGQHAHIVGVPNNVTGEIVGYARALRGNTSQAGGWTGCLRLSGTNHVSPGQGGVTYNASQNEIEGYAWGAIPSTGGIGGNDLNNTSCAGGVDCNGEHYDGVIGWLGFTDVSVNLDFTDTEEVDLFLQVGPLIVYPTSAQGPYDWGTVTLTWDETSGTTNLSSCEAIDTGSTNNEAGNDWFADPKGDPPSSQGNVEVPNNPTKYQIACRDDDGNIVESNIVEVQRQWREPSVSLGTSNICIQNPGVVTLDWELSYVESLTDCEFTTSNTESNIEEYIGERAVEVSNTDTFTLQCPGNDDYDYTHDDSVTIQVGSCEAGDDDDGIDPTYEEI